MAEKDVGTFHFWHPGYDEQSLSLGSGGACTKPESVSLLYVCVCGGGGRLERKGERHLTLCAEVRYGRVGASWDGVRMPWY